MVEEATPTTNSITEKMAHLLENPWIRILVGIGSAVLAFGGLWFTWQTYFGCPELAYEIPKSLAKPIYTDQSLKVFNGSNAMQNPFSTEIKFENIGSKQLEVANYDDDFPPNGPGILIQANNPGAKIVACEASWIDTSERRVPQSIVVDSKALFIKPVSLHNGEGFRLRIISDKNPMPLNVLGHLSIGKISRVEQVNWAAMGYSLWNGFLFIGALLGIISFCLHVYWYFALRSLVKLAVEKTLLAIFKVLGWFGKLFSGSGVRKHATTPQRAREILVSSSEFDSVAKDLGADTFEKRDKLREDLAKIANENEMTNTPPSNSANASDIEQEVCLEVLSEEGNKNMPKTIQEDICISEESPS